MIVNNVHNGRVSNSRTVKQDIVEQGEKLCKILKVTLLP